MTPDQQSTFTPGPWSGVYAEQLDGSMTIAHHGTETTATVADDRLIAAAPELLQALKECAAVLVGSSLHNWEGIERARAVIRKAVGE